MAAPAAPSVFSNIFGGGTVPTADTAKATADIAALNSNFTGMSSTLTSSISLATTLSPDLKGAVDTTALTGALDSAKTLQETCKGLSTDECAKKQAQLQADIDAAQMKFYRDTLDAQITALTTERNKIQNQYNAIQAEKTAALKGGALVFKGEPVFSTYDDLLSRINADIATLEGSTPYIVASTASSGSSGSSAVQAPYQLPVVGTASDYDIEHEQLLATYNNLVGNPYDLNRIMRNIKNFIYRKLVPIAFYLALAFSIVWGGIVCSNMYVEAEKGFLAGRIWYFIHGMIGFPLVLVYSIIKPPYWVSGIFPWYPRVVSEVATPEETPAVISEETPIL
jgi:hypothetical protein